MFSFHMFLEDMLARSCIWTERAFEILFHAVKGLLVNEQTLPIVCPEGTFSFGPDFFTLECFFRLVSKDFLPHIFMLLHLVQAQVLFTRTFERAQVTLFSDLLVESSLVKNQSLLENSCIRAYITPEGFYLEMNSLFVSKHILLVVCFKGTHGAIVFLFLWFYIFLTIIMIGILMIL